MHQAVLYARAKQRTESTKEHVLEDDQQLDFADERKKYQNFWICVNRGIAIDSKNPKILEIESIKPTQVDVNHNKYLFSPLGKYKLLWDFIIGLLIIYSIIVIPVRLGFEPALSNEAHILEDLIILFFALDIIASFNTSFVDPATELPVLDRRAIAWAYLKFWFWVDVLSTFPFDYAADYLAGGGTDISALRVIRALRLFRMFKLFRIARVDDTLQNLRINPHIVSLMGLILGIFFIAHVFACAWHYLALSKEQNSGGETWVTVLGFAGTSLYDRYVASLYYIMVTMMTIGYGDIHPVTDNERIFGIATMLTGGVVFGAMISRLAGILEQRNPEAKALAQNMTELKSYLVDIAVPYETRRRAVEAYNYYLTKKSVFGEPSFFEQLPQPILYRLIRQMNEDDIRCVRLFHTYEMDFVVPLLMLVKPFQAPAGEIIFEEGDVCATIAFLKKGKVAMTSSNGSEHVLVGYVRAGGYFGDMEFLRSSTCFVRYAAAKHSQLLSVSHAAVRHASAKCLDAGVRFKKEATVRCELFDQVIRQNKRDIEHELTQDSLENARIVVDKLLHVEAIKVQRRSSTNLLVTPRSSFTSLQRVQLPKKKQQVKRKSITSSHKASQALWVDGAIVGTRNLSLLARVAEKPLPSEMEGELVRVIHINERGRIGPGEIPVSKIMQQHIIPPLNQYKVAWDMLIVVFVIYTMIVVPIDIAFTTKSYSGSYTTDRVTDAFFLADVVASFRTAYFDDGGDHLVVVPSMIARQYATSWFLPDLLGSLPIDDIVHAFSNDSIDLTFTKLLKAIRLVRLLKIQRLLKLGHISDMVEDNLGLSPSVMALALMLMQVFFVGHLVCCVLYGLSGVITSHPWWAENVANSYVSQEGASLYSKYILSLYWTFTIMSTVGYGDITPGTTSERILNIFVILLGASIFGYMIANVSSLIQGINSSDTAKNDKIASITVFLDEKQVPYKLQDTVVKHFQNYYKHSSAFDVDTMLARLPNRLANEIRLLHHADALKNIAVLRYIDNITVRLFIFNLMMPVYYEPNETILQQGSKSTEIMFLVDGSAVAYKKKEASRRPAKKRPSAGSIRVAMQATRSFIKRGLQRMNSLRVTEGLPYQTIPSANTMQFVNDHTQDPQNHPGSPVEAMQSLPDLREGFPYQPVSSVVGTEIAMENTIKLTKQPRLTLPAASPIIPVLPEEKKQNRISFAIPRLSSFASGKHQKSELELEEIPRVGSKQKVSQTSLMSPPPPLPSRMDKFNISCEIKDVYDSDSESEVEKEYAALRNLHSPLNSTSENNLGSAVDLHAFDFADWGSQKSRKNPPAEKIEEESDNESIEEQKVGAAGRFDPNFPWTEEYMAEKGLQMVGKISPGDFVGHLSLMNDAVCQVTVATASFSTVYVLNKQEISPLLAKQPSVSMQLQMALSRAISTQADVLGKFHMRQARSKFLMRSKEQFYSKLDVLPREVKQIRRAQKNKVKRLATSLKQKMSKPGDCQAQQPSLTRTSSLNLLSEEIDNTDNVEGDSEKGDLGPSVLQRFRSLSITANIATGQAAQALAAQVRTLPRTTVRRVKRVENMLNKHTVLYESDEERHLNTKEDLSGFDLSVREAQNRRKQRVYAHRTPLPLAATLRNVNVRKHPSLQVQPKRRRTSFMLPSVESNGEMQPGMLDRMLSNKKKAQKKAEREDHRHINRVMSLNDLESLDPYPDLTEQDRLSIGSPGSPTKQLSEHDYGNDMRVVPIFTNLPALHHERELRSRRQSFPSLDNKLWKISTTTQGLL